MIQIKVFGPLAALLIVLAFHMPASAASFDCAKATRPLEKLICSDPTLSDLDTQLGHLYREQRALLSPNGAQQFQRSEQSWLRFIATAYPVDGSYNDTPLTVNDLLKLAYGDRIDQLSKVGQKVGPFVFNRIDIFAAEPDPTFGSLSAPGFYVQHTAYPQIDNVHTPITDAWNKQMAKKLIPSETNCDAGLGDDDVDYEIAYASGNLISISSSFSEYCHGTPHGHGGSYTSNLVLHPNLHELEASDIFGPGDQWQAELQDMASKKLDGEGWQAADDNAKQQVLDGVLNSRRWTLSADGIDILFEGSYDAGCYACTPPGDLNFSWQELRPLLTPTWVVPK